MNEEHVTAARAGLLSRRTLLIGGLTACAFLLAAGLWILRSPSEAGPIGADAQVESASYTIARSRQTHAIDADLAEWLGERLKQGRWTVLLDSSNIGFIGNLRAIVRIKLLSSTLQPPFHSFEIKFEDGGQVTCALASNDDRLWVAFTRDSKSFTQSYVDVGDHAGELRARLISMNEAIRERQRNSTDEPSAED